MKLFGMAILIGGLSISSVAFSAEAWTAGSACIPENASSSDLVNAKVGQKGEIEWRGSSTKNLQCGVFNRAFSSTTFSFIVHDRHPSKSITCYLHSKLSSGNGGVQSGGYFFPTDPSSGTGTQTLTVVPQYTNQTIYYSSYCEMPPRSGKFGSLIYAVSSRY